MINARSPRSYSFVHFEPRGTLPGFTKTTKCATKTGAEIMGRGDEFGTLEAGKLADVLVVAGDVVENIRLLENRANFLAVIQGGVIKAGQLADQAGASVARSHSNSNPAPLLRIRHAAHAITRFDRRDNRVAPVEPTPGLGIE